MNEKRPPKEPLTRSGGPAPRIAGSTDSFSPCDCPRWRALYALAEQIARRNLRMQRDMFDCIPRAYDLRTRITSVEPCGSCGRQVELVHPLSPEEYDRLPDLSWVRCASCPAAP